MTRLHKYVAAAGVAALLLASASPSKADEWAAAGIGFAAGALVGAAAASSYYGPGYYYEPGYAYEPAYTYGPAYPVYETYDYAPVYVAPAPYYRSYRSRSLYNRGGASVGWEVQQQTSP